MRNDWGGTTVVVAETETDDEAEAEEATGCCGVAGRESAGLAAVTSCSLKAASLLCRVSFIVLAWRSNLES